MAVQREAGCEFEEVLKTVFTIVSLGASIYGGIATIAGGFQTALEKGHVAKERVKALIGVRGGVKEISKAWKELKPYLNDDKDDIGKILLTDESYKDVLKPYMNMPEAQKLKRELDLYISLVNTRNKKILEISSIDIQIEKNTQEIKQILAEKDRIQSTISITNDPTLPECVMFMSSFLLKVKSQLIYALYNENRAFQYWSLNYNKINLDDQEVLRLEKFHFDLLDKEIQYMNFRGRASQSFKLSKEITERDFPTNFKNFKETGKFVLDIDIEKQNVFFSNWREITLSSINLIFHGVKAKDYISVAVVHGGCAKFKKNDGSIIEFTHRPRVTSIVHKMPYGAESAITPIENNLGSDDNKTFSYLSPFSQWIFFVLPEFNKNLDLSEIDKIEIIFSGHFLPVIV